MTAESAEAADAAQETPVLTEADSPTETETTEVAVAPVLEPVADQVVESAVEPAVEQAPLAGGTGRLQVGFSEECWVSVLDSNGEVLAKRVKPAGSKLDVSGPLPMKVLLGNCRCR